MVTEPAVAGSVALSDRGGDVGAGEVAAEVSAVVTLAAPSSSVGDAGAAVTPTVPVPVELVHPTEGLPEPPQV